MDKKKYHKKRTEFYSIQIELSQLWDRFKNTTNASQKKKALQKYEELKKKRNRLREELWPKPYHPAGDIVLGMMILGWFLLIMIWYSFR